MNEGWCFSPHWEMMRQFETEGAQWGRRWGKDMKWMNKKTIFSWQLLGNIFYKSVTSICTTKENLKLLQVLFRAHFSFLNPCWEDRTWIITFTAPVCYSLYIFYCLLAKMSMRGHAPTVSWEPFFNSDAFYFCFITSVFFFSSLLLPPSRPLSWNDTLQMLCCERWVMNGRQGIWWHMSLFSSYHSCQSNFKVIKYLDHKLRRFPFTRILIASIFISSICFCCCCCYFQPIQRHLFYSMHAPYLLAPVFFFYSTHNASWLMPICLDICVFCATYSLEPLRFISVFRPN